MGIKSKIKQEKLDRINYSNIFNFDEEKRNKICKSLNVETKELSGKEVKEMLSLKVKQSKVFISKLEDSIIKLLDKIVIPANSSVEGNIPEIFRDRVNIPYNLYSYNQIFSRDSDGLMQSYNRHVIELIEKKVECKKLQIICDNICVSQIYKIPIVLLNKLV